MTFTMLSALFLAYLVSYSVTVGRSCEIRPNGTGYPHLETNCSSAGYPEIASRDLLPVNVIQYNVSARSEVRLTCADCSQPLQGVRWRRLAGTDVILKPGISCENNTLIIPDFDVTDSGNYVCNAKCGNKSISEQWKSVWIRPLTCRTSLCYPRVPQSSNIENSVVGQVGKSLTLSCLMEYGRSGFRSLIGYSSAKWIRGRISGSTVPALNLCLHCFSSFSCELETLGNGQEWVNLTIKNVSREDAGWYSCVTLHWPNLPDASVYYYVSVSAADASKSHKISKPLSVAFSVVVVCLILVTVLGFAFLWWKRRQNGEPSTNHVTLRAPSKYIYISYAEDTPTHLTNVRELSSDLSKSFNCRLYNEHRNEAAHMFVPNWLSQQISGAQCVIVIGSPRYQRLTEETRNTGSQPGNDWEQRVRYEWNLIQARVYGGDGGLSSCVTVLWDDSNDSEIPFALSTGKRFRFPRETSELHTYLEGEGLKCEEAIDPEQELERNEGNGQDTIDVKPGRLVFDDGVEVHV